MTQLVLSLFPGIGLLDRGFEDEGFCVVRGPDLLWGGDIKKFHVPAGRFDGVIGGPPCQAFSRLRHLVEATGKELAENLIPEYERICFEAKPAWFLMENVPAAPEPIVGAYRVHSLLLNNRWCPAEPFASVGAEQNRERRFSFGTRDGRKLMPRTALFEAPRKALAVMASGGGVRSTSRSVEAASANGGCFNEEVGVHKRPSLGGHGHGVGVHSDRRHALAEEFEALAERLRGVRVVCGDWKRVVTPSVTTGHGLTGVVLDPPYDQNERAGNIYACESRVSAEVREWAIENGENRQLRIVLCGYEGEHDMPSSWRVAEWKASGGYGHREDNENRHRERLWFSPGCLEPKQGRLFA